MISGFVFTHHKLSLPFTHPPGPSPHQISPPLISYL